MTPELQRTLPAALLRHSDPGEIPETRDVLGAAELKEHLDRYAEGWFSVLVVGDIMLGGRANRVIRKRGACYPFEAVSPLLARACFTLGNLEGPLAEDSTRTERRYSYRVTPSRAKALGRAGISVVNLANNHLTDCGREGVVETLSALREAGVEAIGAGFDKQSAHWPAIREARGLRIGCLGYYWNRRTAATGKLPGSAIGSADWLRADITSLRQRVDRVLVTFHCGIPYERTPLSEDREAAHTAIDCGADAIVNHHAHVIQPFEVYRDKPIFYDVGNFAFGSGNSRGEGIAVGLRFEPDATTATVVPLYVKNRDPRVNYQPKVVRGEAARGCLEKLKRLSGNSASVLQIRGGLGRIVLPRKGG